MEKLLAAVEQTHGFDFGESAVATGLENSAVIRGEISEQISGGARPSGDLPPAPLPAVIGDGEKRKRGRPPKGQAAAAKPPPPKRKKIEEEEDEDVCFICFDGGSLILCDRKGCPKAYHPACIKRDEAFFSTKAKWFCGWHICRTCMKTSHYMCYTCTYSLCKNCIKDADFLCVRGNKGFCTSCMKTIMQFENKDQATNEAAQIDFDDTTSFEYFFKLYWLILKENLSLTMSELMQAKNPWKASTSYRSSEHLELNKPHLDSNSIQNDELKTSISSSCNHVDTSIKKDTAIPKQDKVTEEMSVKEAAKESCIEKDQDVPAVKDTNKLSICKNERESDNSGIVSCQWATKDLLEFVAHMRNGDMSPIPQFDVQTLVIDYIKRNNLRDPRRKSQIICDPRLKNLFGKPRVGHIEMLKLLELHFLVKEDSQQHSLIPAGFVNSVASVVEPAPVNSRKRKTRRKRGITTPPDGLDECAAIDVHNINLVYLRRNLMENLIDDCDNFSNKVIGSFVRIRISSNDQKPEIFRLVQVQGIRKVAEPYKVGDKTTDVMLEVKNLDKIEVVSIDAISNLEFTEDECRRLRQTIRCGLMQHLTVGDIQRKALAIQSVRVNDWLEIEVLRLNHLQNRASEKGHKKELREYVDRLELLKSPEERQRRISEIPEIHTDPKMSPMYESEDDKINGDNREIDVQVRPNHPPYPRNRRKSVSPNKKGKDERTDPPANSPCADHIETEKLWHYRDPNGRIQGPFSMMQLRKWSTTGLFPPDMRIWTNHELFDSLLLSDALVGKLHGASDSLDKPPREKDEATGEIVVPEATNRTSSDHMQAEVPSPDKNTEHVTADEPASSGWPHCWDLLKDSSSKPDDVQSHNLLPSSSSGKEDVALSIRGQESDGEKNSVGLTQNPIVMESVPVLPPVSESPTSNKQSENIEVLDFPSPTPMTENQQSVLADVPVQDSGILELLSPAPRSNNEHQEDQATENKQSGFTLFPNPMPGWNCDSSLGIDTLQIPEVGDPWNGYSPTPARPEWDSGLVSGSSSKPPEVISECIDTSVTHASTSQPAPNWLELKNEPIEFDALGEESVSDLLAEVDAMESRGFPSPTSAMKFVRELFEDCQDDCFSSIEEFQPIKSDALSSTTDVPLTSQSSAPCKPMGSSASSEGETNAPAQYGDAASESHPHGPNNPGQEMVGASGHGSGLEATDQGWGTVQGNINLVTVQGNVNLVLVGGPGQGMGNINWGSNPGPAWTNQSTSRSPRNGSLPWDGQRKYSGERFSSPREWGGYQGGGDSRGRPPWGRQSYGGGGGGGGGYSRPLPKGQRVCKFYESGHCKKGAFCDYLHP